MMHFYDVISVGIEGILAYAKEFPECKEKIGFDTIFADLGISD